MSEILSDAAFTNVEITKNIIFRDNVLIDSNRNIHANVIECNTLSCKNFDIPNSIVTNSRGIDSTSGSSSHHLFETFQGDQNISSEEVGALVVGGQFNESSGEYSVCIGGRYNESVGNESITVGGRENQSTGDCSVSMGASSVALHDNTFVWNANTDYPIETTMSKQCMIGCDNGLFFKLPLSRNIKTHLVPEGFACWCWDDQLNTLCLKTKQNNTLYKTNLNTLVHEISVNVSPTTGSVQLINPDDY